MADLDGSVGALGGKVAVHVRAVPPTLWVCVAALLGAGVVLFHQFSRDEYDVDWGDPEQPAENVPIVLSVVPDSKHQHGTPAVRGRSAWTFTGWWVNGQRPGAGAFAPIPSSGRPEASTWNGTF
jgi:hypothetical protein